MTDGQALLQAIRDNPTDDLPRLAYADWLEEQGGRANLGLVDFIRHQLAHPDSELLVRPAERGARLAGLDPPPWCEYAAWRRGFLAVVRCTPAAWLEHGPALVRLHPLERVELSDRHPARAEGALFVGWYRGGYGVPENTPERYPSILPAALFDLLAGHLPEGQPEVKEYPTAVAALAALSDAALALARPACPTQAPASGEALNNDDW